MSIHIENCILISPDKRKEYLIWEDKDGIMHFKNLFITDKSLFQTHNFLRYKLSVLRKQVTYLIRNPHETTTNWYRSFHANYVGRYYRRN